ncbi:hypothetical protein MUP46_01600 [Patescibacteria group bacterium]|nr:hypothetical protein [Patescibacteria group bacterium]
MKKILNKIHTPNWLTILLGIVLILRIPSFFEPYSYGDEMVYLTLGNGIRQGITLYSGIYDNKPPLLYITAAVAGSLFWFKVILAFWSLGTIVLFWHLSKTLFPGKEKLHKVATAIFALITTIPLFEGNIANAEIFMIGPIIAAFLILFSKPETFKNIFWAGVLFSIATLFKIPAAFDVPAIVFLWLIKDGININGIKAVAKKTWPLVLGFIVPIGLTFLWFAFKGSLKDYFTAAFLQNLGYLSSWRVGTQGKSLLKNLPLFIRGFVVLIGAGLLYWKRAKFSKQFIFLCLWLLFSLFAVTLSERPYPHYLIQSLAPTALLFGVLVADKTLEQSLVILPLAIFFLVPVYYKFWYYPTATYYQRFASFASMKMDKQTYLASFGASVPRDYKIADFLVKSMMPGETVFVWGDSPSIYALSRKFPPIKYVAGYHINDFSSKADVEKQFEKNKPTFIVLLPDAQAFTELTPLIRTSYIRIASVEGAEVWRFIRTKAK